ncbi:hypothetical protein ACA910_000495 [Epithemia clementina (nom. ined.)]
MGEMTIKGKQPNFAPKSERVRRVGYDLDCPSATYLVQKIGNKHGVSTRHVKWDGDWKNDLIDETVNEPIAEIAQPLLNPNAHLIPDDDDDVAQPIAVPPPPDPAPQLAPIGNGDPANEREPPAAPDPLPDPPREHKVAQGVAPVA